ncbi:hypothetical protein RIF29_00851 [Crotalaria pallida]|uniref:Uncharacterized protein n=1 Tax=Crotalaria pallida TaxID=3830 RepID=A0AAN9P6U9_CROPI
MLVVVASAFGDAGSVVDGDDSGGGGGSGSCSCSDADGVEGDIVSVVDSNDGGSGRGSCSDGDSDLLVSYFSLLSDRMVAEVEFDGRDDDAFDSVGGSSPLIPCEQGSDAVATPPLTQKVAPAADVIFTMTLGVAPTIDVIPIAVQKTTPAVDVTPTATSTEAYPIPLLFLQPLLRNYDLEIMLKVREEGPARVELIGSELIVSGSSTPMRHQEYRAATTRSFRFVIRSR